jgi:hypothetical protein
MGLGLILHVLIKVDAWWKPEFTKSQISLRHYFKDYPLRSFISMVATLIVGLLLWQYGIRDAAVATAAGYMGNSMLDGFLGQRVPKQ